MASVLGTAMPSTLPTPSPTALPTTPIPSVSPSLMPSPSPTPFPTQMPSTAPTSSPTVTCPCLIVADPNNTLMDYVGMYRYNGSSSPTTDHWMWERLGDDTQELIYFSEFGTNAARWVIEGSTDGERAETSADTSAATPPESAVW